MAFDQSLYPQKPRRHWPTFIFNVLVVAVALGLLIAISPYVWRALTEWETAVPAPVEPTAYVMPTRRPIVQQQAPVLSMPIPTLMPGLATEQESEAIYLATAEAMQAGPPIPDGVEYGSKPSEKAWPTPAPAVVEVQAAPVPTPDRFGSKPSQKRHP